MIAPQADRDASIGMGFLRSVGQLVADRGDFRHVALRLLADATRFGNGNRYVALVDHGMSHAADPGGQAGDTQS